MARAVFISPTDNPSRAAALGVGFVLDPSAPTAYVLIQGLGTEIKLNEPTTKTAVNNALAPIIAAEQAAASDEAGRTTNADTLRAKGVAALAANATYLASAAYPAGTALTTTQLTTIVRAQRTQIDLLTKEVNALIRLALGLLDTISDT